MTIRDERREQVLAAASTCFARGGFHGTSMQDVARAARMSPGSIYRWFRGKDEIVEALCEQERARSVAMLARVRDRTDTVAALHEIVDELAVEMADRGPAALSVEIAAEAARNPRVRVVVAESQQAVVAALAATLAHAQAAGRVDPGADPAPVAQLLVAVLDGLVVHTAVDPALDLAALTGTLKRLVTRVLAPTTQEDRP